MKSTLLIISLILTGLANITAQSNIHLLLKAGMNYSTITNLANYEKKEPGTHIDTQWKSGLNLGIGVEWNASKKFALETGLYYSEYRAKYSLTGRENLGKISALENFMLLQIPIMAKYYCYKGVNIFAGPQIGYKLAPDTKYVMLMLGGKDIYYSGIIGLGYQFDFGLSLTANYIHGFTIVDDYADLSNPIVNDGEELPIDKTSLNAKSRAFQFNIGWKF